jgi:DNA-binding phage protein
MGKQKGIQVVLGLVCDDPICNYQNEITVNEQRDALIVAGVLAKVSVSRIAAETGMSRQRIYQIMDMWKAGI